MSLNRSDMLIRNLKCGAMNLCFEPYSRSRCRLSTGPSNRGTELVFASGGRPAEGLSAGSFIDPARLDVISDPCLVGVVLRMERRRAGHKRKSMNVFRSALFSTALITGACAPSFAQSGSPFATQDPLAKELQRANVFVGKTLRDQIDSGALERITLQEPPDRPLKIAVLNQLPESGKVYGTSARYTKALHDYLGLGRGTLLIVTKRGPLMATDALPVRGIDEILQRNVRAIQTDPVKGIESTMADLDAAVGGSPQGAGQGSGSSQSGRRDAGPENDQGIPGWLIGVPLLAAGGVAIWATQRASKKRKAMAAARLPVDRLRRQVLEGLTYTDTYLDLLPPSQDAASAREERQRAAALLEQAAGFARAARTPEDFGRVEALLEQAKQAADSARADVDRATGGTGMAVALDGTENKATPVNPDGTPNMRAAPILTGMNAEDIPMAERAACFFCSRPGRLQDLTPVTVAINGERRKVLACSDDVLAIQQGATPAVRTVQVSGQSVPWYRSNSYDPYRDYHHTVGYDPYYGYGYGGGVIDGIFLGAMLSNPAPFAYPVFVNNEGFATADPGQAVMPDNSLEFQDAGSASFFGMEAGSDFANGPDTADFGSDNNGADFAAGNDAADFGGADSGGSDSGGGWDSGSSDSGGGWDSGGSDSGGGGDSGGGDF